MTLEEAQKDPIMRSVWGEHLPRLSRQIIEDNIPRLVGMITSRTIANVQSRSAKIRTGDVEESGSLKDQLQKIGHALYQMNLPAGGMVAETPCTISNVMILEARDLCPNDLRPQNSVLEIFPAEGLSFNVAPAGAFSDLHADSCTVGRATCFGRCIKTFVCFAPTEKNLDLWKDGLGLYDKLSRYGSKLEYGVIVRIGNDIHSTGNSIKMSSGTIHSVMTNEGGLLGGFNYSTTEALLLSSKMICMQFRRWQQDDQIVEDVKWYRQSLQLCLAQVDDQLYPVAWHSLVLLLEECEQYPNRSTHKAFLQISQASKEAWSQWKKVHMRSDGRISCVCGTDYDSFQDHYTIGKCKAIELGIKLSHWY